MTEVGRNTYWLKGRAKIHIVEFLVPTSLRPVPVRDSFY
jgi:hypothetical protein